MNKEDCTGYDICRKYSKQKDLCCEDCDHYVPDSCWEDYGGKKPFWVLAKERI